MNINIELFKRYQPKKKLQMIENLTESELRAVTTATIIRIVKETGEHRYGGAHDKILYFGRGRHAGNNWNSELDAVEWEKKKLYVWLYVQYGESETDTTEIESYNKFFCSGEYNGSIKGTDRHGNPRYYYYTYDQDDKIRCIRAILNEYVYTKYADKLKQQ